MTSQTAVMAPENQVETSDGRKKRRWPAIVSLLILCNGLAFYFGSKRSEGPPRLDIVEQQLDFGTVPPAGDFEHSVTLDNPTAETIEVALRASCKCTKIDPKSVVIPARQSRTVTVALNLMPIDNVEATEPVREFDVDIIAELRGARLGTQRWTLSGRIASPVTLARGLIQFSRELVRGRPFEPCVVLVRAHEGATTIRAVCDPELADCNVAPVPERPGEFQLQVLPSTALEDGPFQFQVGLVGVSASGEETAGYSLRVTGTVWPEVRISPSPLALGAMRQGTPRTVAVELQSRSERAFTINGVSGASSVAVCGDLPVGAALFQKLQLGIACDEAGPVSENVQFELQLGDDEPITIDVPVSLYGIGEQVLELKFPEPASS